MAETVDKNRPHGEPRRRRRLGGAEESVIEGHKRYREHGVREGSIGGNGFRNKKTFLIGRKTEKQITPFLSHMCAYSLFKVIIIIVFK